MKNNNKPTMESLSTSDLKKLVKILHKIIQVCPESELDTIQAELDHAEKLLESMKG